MPYINMPSIINDNINDMNSPVIAVIHCFSKKTTFLVFSTLLSEKIKEIFIDKVRGLRTGYKDVVYYSFDTRVTLELLNKVILRTEQAGGDVRLVSMDLGNKTLLSQLKVKNIM